MSATNPLTDVPHIVDDLWKQSLSVHLLRDPNIDPLWLHRMNKFVNEYAQIISRFRHQLLPLKTRLWWDDQFAELMNEHVIWRAQQRAAETGMPVDVAPEKPSVTDLVGASADAMQDFERDPKSE